VVVACAQERFRFAEIAAELDLPEPDFLDIRDRAGWSEQAAEPGPKMAALAAESLLHAPPVKTFDIASEGLCLILGAADVAFDAARLLGEHCSVTVLLSEETEPPADAAFDVVIGTLKTAKGAFGQFELSIDALRQVQPGGRGEKTFEAPRDGGQTDDYLSKRRDH